MKKNEYNSNKPEINVIIIFMKCKVVVINLPKFCGALNHKIPCTKVSKLLIQIILRRWNLTFLLCYHEFFISERQHVKLHNILFKTRNNRQIDSLIRIKFNLFICIVYSDIKIQTLKTKLNKFWSFSWFDESS